MDSPSIILQVAGIRHRKPEAGKHPCTPSHRYASCKKVYYLATSLRPDEATKIHCVLSITSRQTTTSLVTQIHIAYHALTYGEY